MIPDWLFWYLCGLITAFVLVAAIGAWYDRRERTVSRQRLDTFKRHLRQLSDGERRHNRRLDGRCGVVFVLANCHLEDSMSRDMDQWAEDHGYSWYRCPFCHTRFASDSGPHHGCAEEVQNEIDDEECGECGGEGWITADCFEDTCCCADPETEHGLIPCPLCNPRGEK